MVLSGEAEGLQRDGQWRHFGHGMEIKTKYATAAAAAAAAGLEAGSKKRQWTFQEVVGKNTYKIAWDRGLDHSGLCRLGRPGGLQPASDLDSALQQATSIAEAG